MKRASGERLVQIGVRLASVERRRTEEVPTEWPPAREAAASSAEHALVVGVEQGFAPDGLRGDDRTQDHIERTPRDDLT